MLGVGKDPSGAFFPSRNGFHTSNDLPNLSLLPFLSLSLLAPSPSPLAPCFLPVVVSQRRNYNTTQQGAPVYLPRMNGIPLPKEHRCECSAEVRLERGFRMISPSCCIDGCAPKAFLWGAVQS